MDFRRIKQVCEYGWKDAETLSKEEGSSKGRWSIFCDILHCFFKYNVWSNQYKKEKLHLLSGEQKNEICLKYQVENNYRDEWVKSLYANFRFLRKWSDFKYDAMPSTQKKRCRAYQRHYNLPKDSFIGHSVLIQKRHYQDSIFKIGSNCVIASNSDLDYTGNLIFGNNVTLSEGTKILTHNHTIDYLSHKDLSHGAICTPLKVHNRVAMGTKVLIMPGVEEIGRGAYISAGAVVRKKVPPYAIVMGNPSMVVGFRYTPNQILELEEEEYPVEERLSEKELNENYKKYYLDKLQEIKHFIG